MTDEKPSRPVPSDSATLHGVPDAPTVPAGLRLELSRSRIIDGYEAEFDGWMQMLNDRCDESLAAIPAERAVFEATFRHTEGDGSTWIYHLSLVGENGGLDESHQIDADHAAFSRRVKKPSWEGLQPKFMLCPTHILATVTAWGLPELNSGFRRALTRRASVGLETHAIRQTRVHRPR